MGQTIAYHGFGHFWPFGVALMYVVLLGIFGVAAWATERRED
jgi:hypothetical protein